MDTTGELLALIRELRTDIRALTSRVATLEAQHALALKQEHVPSEDEMLAVSAAVAAFLGVKTRIRQVRLVHSATWAQVGRVGIQASHTRN